MNLNLGCWIIAGLLRGGNVVKMLVLEDDEARRWRYRRYLLRLGLVALGMPIAFYFGPNWILFGKLTRLSVEDFVPIVQQEGVPIVRAMKEYERDTGRLPATLEDLQPRYLPAGFGNHRCISNGYFHLGTRDHEVEYEFKPGVEGWWVIGPFVSGAIPVPPVTIGPATRPISPVR